MSTERVFEVERKYGNQGSRVLGEPCMCVVELLRMERERGSQGVLPDE